MPNQRDPDQVNAAFHASRDLLARAKARARTLRMDMSGFYRYCLAKELGYSQDDASLIAEPRSVQKLRGLALHEQPEISLVAPAVLKKSVVESLVEIDETAKQAAAPKPVTYGPKRGARSRSKTKLPPPKQGP